MFNPITESDVQNLAVKWFSLLMKHAPVEDYLPLFDFENPDFKMQLSTFSISNFEDFKKWYVDYSNTYFNSTHELGNINSIMQGEDSTKVEAIEHWIGSFWLPPKATSNRMELFATQSWQISRSKSTGEPIFLSYIPVAFKFADGSAMPPAPGSSSNTSPPNDNKVRGFIYNWYSWFDALSDGVEILNHLSNSNLKMDLKNQNIVISNHDEFKAWWKNVRSTLAKNSHSISDIQISKVDDFNFDINLKARFQGVTKDGTAIDSLFKVDWNMNYNGNQFIISYYSVQPI